MCKHEQMIKKDIWVVINTKDVIRGSTIIDSTWVMKKKANGNYSAQLAAWGLKQTQVKLFLYHNISLPVLHDNMVHIMLVLMLMGNMCAHLIDVDGAFLLG